VLSTFIHYPEAELARLVFHELAHQVAYAAGDSQFNESFATAVEEIGVDRWLALRGDNEVRVSYKSFRQRREDFLKLLDSYRVQLDELYRSDRSDADKRQEKSRLMTGMQTDYIGMKASWGGYAGYDRWFSEPMSNARPDIDLSRFGTRLPRFTEGKTASSRFLPGGAITSAS
jgi:predicted aminopeptidase